ncbi:hypothetical protein K474DRAFT_1106919 [Panus rudis PR-1116 ss-1]|nr:hypothetical protein K474DRAFT_1106919 [Panus rudis PR-1116 ss-1]
MLFARAYHICPVLMDESRCMSLLAQVTSFLGRTVLRARLWLYFGLTRPGTCDDEIHIRFFRWGIPLVLKQTSRTISTEADALRFLNREVPHLPIPKLIDTFQLDGSTYTVMTKLPGQRLDDLPDMDPDDFSRLISDILYILDELCNIPQPSTLSGKVMASASGHGLPHPVGGYEGIGGPYNSIYELYQSMVLDLTMHSPETLRPILEDRVVWIPTDLAKQNILIQNGKLSGIVDWQDAGWLPRHWLLHRLRTPRLGCSGQWVRYWLFEHKFERQIEAAYEASRVKDMLEWRI